MSIINDEDFLPAVESTSLSKLGRTVQWALAAPLAFGLDWYEMLGFTGAASGSA